MEKTIIDITNAFPRSPEFYFYEPINWTLKENEHWAFLGPNGAGKTLFARLVKGELPLKSGRIQYDFFNQ